MADLKSTCPARFRPLWNAETFGGGREEFDATDPAIGRLLSLLDTCRRFTRGARRRAASEAMRHLHPRRAASAAEQSGIADGIDEECERWDGLS